MVATSVRLRKLVCVRFGVNAIKTIVLLYGFIAKRNLVNAACIILRIMVAKRIENYSGIIGGNLSSTIHYMALIF